MDVSVTPGVRSSMSSSSSEEGGSGRSQCHHDHMAGAAGHVAAQVPSISTPLSKATSNARAFRRLEGPFSPSRSMKSLSAWTALFKTSGTGWYQAAACRPLASRSYSRHQTAMKRSASASVVPWPRLTRIVVSARSPGAVWPRSIAARTWLCLTFRRSRPRPRDRDPRDQKPSPGFRLCPGDRDGRGIREAWGFGRGDPDVRHVSAQSGFDPVVKGGERSASSGMAAAPLWLRLRIQRSRPRSPSPRAYPFLPAASDLRREGTLSATKARRCPEARRSCGKPGCEVDPEFRDGDGEASRHLHHVRMYQGAEDVAIATTSAKGWITPGPLFAAMTETRAGASAEDSAFSRAEDDDTLWIDCRMVAPGTALSTSCSISVVMTGRRAG